MTERKIPSVGSKLASVNFKYTGFFQNQSVKINVYNSYALFRSKFFLRRGKRKNEALNGRASESLSLRLVQRFFFRVYISIFVTSNDFILFLIFSKNSPEFVFNLQFLLLRRRRRKNEALNWQSIRITVPQVSSKISFLGFITLYIYFFNQ